VQPLGLQHGLCTMQLVRSSEWHVTINAGVIRNYSQFPLAYQTIHDVKISCQSPTSIKPNKNISYISKSNLIQEQYRLDISPPPPPKMRDVQNASEWQMKLDNKRTLSYDIEGAAVIPSSILTDFVFSCSANKHWRIQLDMHCHFKQNCSVERSAIQVHGYCDCWKAS